MDPPVALQRTDKAPSEQTNLQNMLKTPKMVPQGAPEAQKGFQEAQVIHPKKQDTVKGHPKIRAWHPKDPYISESTGGPTG